jgi:hypothetical protein
MFDSNESFLFSTYPDAANDPVQAQPQASGDLQRLTRTIAASRGNDRLAVDILDNLAAVPGPAGREAQDALRSLYAAPLSGDLPGDEQVRAALLRSARSVCEFSLVTAPRLQSEPVELPLSMLVASMGARCPTPQSDPELGAAVQAHLERRLNRAGRKMAAGVAVKPPRYKRH